MMSNLISVDQITTTEESNPRHKLTFKFDDGKEHEIEFPLNCQRHDIIYLFGCFVESFKDSKFYKK